MLSCEFLIRGPCHRRKDDHRTGHARPGQNEELDSKELRVLGWKQGYSQFLWVQSPQLSAWWSEGT